MYWLGSLLCLLQFQTSGLLRMRYPAVIFVRQRSELRPHPHWQTFIHNSDGKFPSVEFYKRW